VHFRPGTITCILMPVHQIRPLISLSLTYIGDNAAQFVAARDRVLDVAAPSSYQLALECLDHCARFHEQCPKPMAATLPDRVIDCSTPENPKIVLTNGNMQGLYVTLSYIWGGPQPTSSTQNIEMHVTQGLKMKDFPNTIREAVSATHRLGLRYLWIDALCILQDSMKDKIRQIGMMGSIYQNSYVTIIAACGNNVNEGFLHQSRPQKIPDARIPYICPDGKIGSVWIAEAQDHRPNDCSRSYYDDLEPINYRGWCLQERLLSSRCLIYASHTLQYDCQAETVNIGQALCERGTISRLPSITFPASPSDQMRARRAWISTIWDYSSRNLTVSADKLVAFAGVAECFQRFFSSSYLAGLWENSLLLDLLWFKVSDEPLPRIRPTEYRAPSWSWASIDGRVQFQMLEHITKSSECEIVKCGVLGCKVAPLNKDMPFCQVDTGTLILNGLLKEVKLDSEEKSSNVLIRSGPEGALMNIGQATFDAKERRDNTYCIPLMWDKGGAFVEGLIVSAVSGGCFRRVGRFTNKYKSTDIKWIEGASKQTLKII